MKIILLKDIAKVGRKYEVKNAADGHAANMLIPRGLAIPATPENLRRMEAEKKVRDGERKVQDELLTENFKSLEGVTLAIVGKASDKGHLFASIHTQNISDELSKQARLEVPASFIQLQHPIKEVGEHIIEIKAEGKSAKLKVVVKAA